MKPIINSHTHIFTKKHIPRDLGKKIVPLGLWRLLPTPFLIWLASQGRYDSILQEKWRSIQGFYNYVHKNLYYKLWVKVILIPIYVSFFVIVLTFWGDILLSEGWWIKGGFDWIKSILPSFLFRGDFQVILFIIGLLFSVYFRRIFWLILSSSFRFLSGPIFKEYLSKIIKMGIYAFYSDQKKVLDKLIDQYPEQTKFVVLPMDMEYMDAGPIEESYHEQLENLEGIANDEKYKELIIPFIFVDPRRITDEEGYLALVKQKLLGVFKGIKLYPALGYFPFHKNLLELYLFAVVHQIPIITHCIQGTIFYRGKKEFEMHPIFPDLKLEGYSNYEFCNHFGHPLNYECLLNPIFLKKVLVYHNDDDLNQLFGFNPKKPEKRLHRDLKRLKICLAHFGGTDQWRRHQVEERNDFEKRVGTLGSFDPIAVKENNFENLWEDASWYVLILNMLATYPNVYADISYILHDTSNYSLLRRTLTMDTIREKVLFGSDYYVVRQKKTERELQNELFSFLTEDEIDLVARRNNQTFLFEKSFISVKGKFIIKEDDSKVNTLKFQPEKPDLLNNLSQTSANRLTYESLTQVNLFLETIDIVDKPSSDVKKIEKWKEAVKSYFAIKMRPEEVSDSDFNGYILTQGIDENGYIRAYAFSGYPDKSNYRKDGLQFYFKQIDLENSLNYYLSLLK